MFLLISFSHSLIFCIFSFFGNVMSMLFYNIPLVIYMRFGSFIRSCISSYGFLVFIILNAWFFSFSITLKRDVIIRVFSLVGILSFFVSPGFSLGWQDEEWLRLGCPKTASGNWTANNPANKNLSSLSINNNQVIYTSQSGEGQKFQIINCMLQFINYLKGLVI